MSRREVHTAATSVTRNGDELWSVAQFARKQAACATPSGYRIVQPVSALLALWLLAPASSALLLAAAGCLQCGDRLLPLQPCPGQPGPATAAAAGGLPAAPQPWPPGCAPSGAGPGGMQARLPGCRKVCVPGTGQQLQGGAAAVQRSSWCARCGAALAVRFHTLPLCAACCMWECCGRLKLEICCCVVAAPVQEQLRVPALALSVHYSYVW